MSTTPSLEALAETKVVQESHNRLQGQLNEKTDIRDLEKYIGEVPQDKVDRVSSLIFFTFIESSNLCVDASLSRSLNPTADSKRCLRQVGK
jgi:hypothetical protein